MDYQKAESLFKTARSKDAGKPLCNNTRLFKRGEKYAVQLHQTDVVTLHPDGTYTLNSGGWMTATTKERINEYGPGWNTVSQENGIWYVEGSLFEDGMVIDSSGELVSPGIDPKPLEKAKRKVDKLVRDYVKGSATNPRRLFYLSVRERFWS